MSKKIGNTLRLYFVISIKNKFFVILLVAVIARNRLQLINKFRRVNLKQEKQTSLLGEFLFLF